MRRCLEATYVASSAAPLVFLGLVMAQTEGSLVSGVAIGSAIPLLAAVSLFLTLLGAALTLLARRQRRRSWHLVLGALMASPIAVLVALTWLFG